MADQLHHLAKSESDGSALAALNHELQQFGKRVPRCHNVQARQSLPEYADETVVSPGSGSSGTVASQRAPENPLDEPIVTLGLQKIQVSSAQLMSMSVKELNKRLVSCPPFVIAKLKRCRRTLKNRGYAKNCRIKRIAARNELEKINAKLVQENRELRRLNKTLLQRMSGESGAAMSELQTDSMESSPGGSGSSSSSGGASVISAPGSELTRAPSVYTSASPGAASASGAKLAPPSLSHAGGSLTRSLSVPIVAVTKSIQHDTPPSMTGEHIQSAQGFLYDPYQYQHQNPHQNQQPQQQAAPPAPPHNHSIYHELTRQSATPAAYHMPAMLHHNHNNHHNHHHHHHPQPQQFQHLNGAEQPSQPQSSEGFAVCSLLNHEQSHYEHWPGVAMDC